MRRRMKGFTLIELIAVLVILAILALIVTPLVMNIVKKAKDASNRRSVDAYGKSVELAVATYLLDNGDYPESLDNLTVEYSGNEVTCLTKTLNSDGSIYLSGCSVKNTEVLDSNNTDGYYHFGRLTDNNSSPLLPISSYQVGDQVVYRGINFYVLETSDDNQDYVKLLKAEPLTVEEVNTYGVDDGDVNHINQNSSGEESGVSDGETVNNYGYGGVAYYSSDSCYFKYDCGYGCGYHFVGNNCSNNYAESMVKYIVDAWEKDKLLSSDIKESSRLITYDEYKNNCTVEMNAGVCHDQDALTAQYDWLIDERYDYWTMTPYDDTGDQVYSVTSTNEFGYNTDYVAHARRNVIRPVVTLYKSALN